MYEFDDLQIILDSKESKAVVQRILAENNIKYEDVRSHFKLNDKTIIVCINKRVIFLYTSQISETLYINNRFHMDRLVQLLSSLNEQS